MARQGADLGGSATATRAHGVAQVQLGAEIDGRFRVLRALGQGGAGSVYAVSDRASGQELALKLLAEDASPRVKALFEREYYTLSSLRHPNVVEVYDYGTLNGRPYYTMELLRGSDLAGLAPVAPSVALAYARDTASALAALHARHLIHRDVSPRNLWLCEAGALKLLDFGALTGFGAPGDVVGTPPFVSPEALLGQHLDQRSDLYALGGLLYWLLTGVHAYPARALRELPEAWAHAPLVPSARRAQLAREDLPPVPEEVDALVQALLSRDPSARPATAGEVIDRIGSVLGGARSGDAREVAAMLVARPPFVGRSRERKHFARQLKLALGGRGGATLIEAEAGGGSTRLLAELALQGRLEGAVTVVLDAGAARAAGGLVGLVLRLFDARPEVARQAFEGHAELLAHAHEGLRARFRGEDGERRSSVPSPVLADGDARAALQDALLSGVLAFASLAPLVLLVDDLEQLDDATVAVLALLAERAAEAKLLMLAAYQAQQTARRSAQVRALARVARRITLRALTPDETLSLTRAIFADVPHLGRLAERVHRTSHGNPGQVCELLRELVEGGVVVHADGTWVLPQELPDEIFGRTRPELVARRLGRLSRDARQVARVLSVSADALSLAAVKSLVELEQRDVFQRLDELVRASLLLAQDDGYRFADEGTRRALRAELGEPEARRAHLALGRHLLSHEASTLAERLDAVVHMLEGGERREAPVLLHGLVRAIVEGLSDELPAVSARLATALQLYRAEGCSAYVQLPLLHALAAGGYYGDRRVAELYGPHTASLLHELTGLALAARLGRWLGRTLALVVGLVVGAARFRVASRDPRVPSFKEAVRQCVNVCTTMCGMSTISVNPAEARHYAGLLTPFKGFGRGHPFAVLADFPRALALSLTDRFDTSRRMLEDLRVRIEDPRMRRFMPELLRHRYLDGVLYALGVQHCWFEDARALALADELEQRGSRTGRMSADQVRTLYYANRGDRERFEFYRQRVEQHAIKHGSAWQVETWTPGAMISVAVRSRDAMALKHACEQLERLEKRLPSLGVLRARARGAYLVLRRRPVEALPELERAARGDRYRLVGASRAAAAYVRAFNMLGQHQRAYEAADAALRAVKPADRRAFPQLLGLQVEHALARSGLNDHAGARAALEALLVQAEQGGAGAITRGNLHEAMVEVAQACGDTALGEQHAAAMAEQYRSTGLPTLLAHLQVVERQRLRPQGSLRTGTLELTLSGTMQGTLAGTHDHTALAFTRLEAELGQGSALQLGERALRFLAEQAGCERAGLWLCAGGGATLVAARGAALPDELGPWVDERVAAARDDDITQTDFVEPGAEPSDPNRRELAGAHWELNVLTAQQDGRDVPVAALVVARSLLSRPIHPDLLRAVGTRLSQHPTSSLRLSLSNG